MTDQDKIDEAMRRSRSGLLQDNARYVGKHLCDIWHESLIESDELRDEIIRLARELVSPMGMVNRGVDRGLVVIEKADKSDPHYRLCTALDRLAVLEVR